MVANYWRLKHEPFPTQVEPRAYAPTAGHEEALARLEFLVEQRRRLGWVRGDAGVGKSLALRLVERAFAGRPVVVSYESLVGLRPRDLLWRLAAAWGIDPQRREDTFSLWRRIEDEIRARALSQTHTLVLLDDADECPPPTVDTILRLTTSPALTVVVASRQTSSYAVRRMVDRVDLRIDLYPWRAEETAACIAHALANAGGGDAIFTSEAVSLLHQLCDGVPRRVFRLAGLCLLAGAGQQLSFIDAATVESVHHELDIIGHTQFAA